MFRQPLIFFSDRFIGRGRTDLFKHLCKTYAYLFVLKVVLTFVDGIS